MKAPTPATRTVEVHERSGAVTVKEIASYATLLDQAHGLGLARVRTSVIQLPTEENGHTAILKAEIETAQGLFEAHGDASPDSVDPDLVPHLIRVAETRAKARALRDAVNSGIVSLEELDGVRPLPASRPGSGATAPRRGPSRTGSGAPRTDPPRAGNGADGLMSEAQRRYLMRLLAARGHTGKAAEDYLFAEFDVRDLGQVTSVQASSLIDALLQTPVPQGRGGNGAARPQQ
jgi:hypothetical protein